MATGIYTGSDLVIVMIQPTRANGGNGKSTHFRQFAVRDNRNYTRDDNVEVEKQPVDFYCTTWVPEVISALDNFKKDDRVDLTAFVEPVLRGYIANNTPKGVQVIIPDTGQPEVVVDPSFTVYPNAHPYRLNGQVSNTLVYVGVSLNVTKLTPATDLANAVAEVENDGQNALYPGGCPMQPMR